MGHLAGGQIGKVAFRQGLQREAGAPGADRKHGAVAGALDHDLRALGQFAHDFIEHVRRHGGGARLLDVGGDAFDHFEVEVGGLELKPPIVGAEQHVAQNRNRIAPFHHAMDMAERLSEFGALDGGTHETPREATGARRISNSLEHGWMPAEAPRPGRRRTGR